MKKLIKPYLQGDLDSYCGLYSMVNIAHYLTGPLTQNQAEDLMTYMLYILGQKDLAENVFSEGLGLQSIAFLAKTVLLARYGITYRKPFHLGQYPTIGGVVNRLRHVTLSRGYIALIAIEGKYSHWVPITNITDKSLICFDSSDLKLLPIDQISTNENSTKTHILYPRHCYVFKKP